MKCLFILLLHVGDEFDFSFAFVDKLCTWVVCVFFYTL